MATLVLRAGKGSPLTNAEVDANFTNLNTEVAAAATTATWTGITGKPATLAGYGITDAAPSSHVGSTGTAHGVATTSVAGFMSSTDKTKLDGVAAGAQVNTVTSVAGKTGAVSLVNSDVGLGNVENKSSATIRSELTSLNVTTALGFTPLSLAGGTVTGNLIVTGGSVQARNGIYYYGWNSDTTNYWALANTGATGANNPVLSFILQGGAAGASLSNTGFSVTGNLTASGTLSATGAITQNGNQVLHAGNYTSYSPSLTGSGASGTWGISVTGNAATATTLQTARTINGVSFNGSANITIADATKLPLTGGILTGAIRVYLDGAASLAPQLYWANAANNRAYNWQLDENNSAALWGYNGSAWAKLLAISSSGALATNGPLTVNSSGGTSTDGLIVNSNGASGLHITPASGDTTQSGRLFFTTGTAGQGFSVRNSGGSLLIQSGATYGSSSGSTVALTLSQAGALNTAGAITQNGSQVLTAGNYNSYSPTLTGTGASGSWGISITGNAATATTLQTARTINGVSFNGSANVTVTTAGTGIGVSGTAVSIAAAYSPNTSTELETAVDLDTLQTAGFYYQTTNADAAAGSNYPVAHAGSMLIQRSAGVTQQYQTYGTSDTELYFRSFYNTVWGSWRRVLTSSNYNSFSPTLTGGGASGSWGISVTGSAATLTTARTLTIGSTGKTFNGSANVSWSLAEIGAQAAGNYVTTDTAQTVTAAKTFSGEVNLFNRLVASYNEFQYAWGGGTDLNWKKVAVLASTVTDGYRGVSGQIIVCDELSNHGVAQRVEHRARFYVQFANNGTATDNAAINGSPGFGDVIRLQKIDVRNYEVQVRQFGNYRLMGATLQMDSYTVNSGNAISITTTQVPPDGAAGISTVTAGVLTENFNISGNAATVTNGVVTTGSYADPAWITSLNYSKLTGTVPTWNQNTTGSAATLTTARAINGTSFNGSADITTANWGTARTLTIGNTGKSVNGSANISWALSEIGAAAASFVGSGQVMKNGVIDTYPENGGFVHIPTLFNDLAFNNQRGGSVSITRNGTTLNYPTLDNAFGVGGLMVMVPTATTDTFVITVNTHRTFTYGNVWGISMGEAWNAKNVTIEVFFNGAWTTAHTVTNDTSGHVWKYYTGNGANTISAVRYTLTNLTSAAFIRISSIFAVSYNSLLATEGYLTRNGGNLYGTNAAPPTLQAAGGDANIDLDLRSKGTGVVEANGNTILHAANYNTYAPTLTGTGASGSWGISVTGSAATLTTARTLTLGATGKTFNGSANVAWTLTEIAAGQTITTSGSSASIIISDTGASGANIRLTGNGATTPSKTIRAQSGMFQVINNAYTAPCMSVDDAGNFTANANVIAYSDERLKKDWAPVASDYVARLAKLKSGTYTRIDSGERQAGSSAQDWQQLLPEVVASKDETGILGLAYGNAAVVSVIELAKDNLELRARIERLEALIEKMIGD